MALGVSGDITLTEEEGRGRERVYAISEFRSRVKVEVAVLDSRP